jgi:hypothetical protein
LWELAEPLLPKKEPPFRKYRRLVTRIKPLIACRQTEQRSGLGRNRWVVVETPSVGCTDFKLRPGSTILHASCLGGLAGQEEIQRLDRYP